MSPADASGATSPEPDRHEDEISLLEVLNLMLRHRYRILGTALAFAFLALLMGLLSQRTYTATASFVPQGASGGQGRLSALAGQFGVSVPGGDAPGESPAFYAELVRSREILRALAEERYDLVADGPGSGGEGERVTGTLPELLQVDADGTERRTRAAMDWLRGEAIQVQTDAETGIVTVSVETPWAALSYAITARLVDLVNQFNLETRQSRAAAERSFIEERLAEAEDSLRAAEDRLEGFLQSNRQFENSPELLFQHDRLQRQVTRRQEVVTSLAQAYEEARVNEVRNTPVITVVEAPEMPIRPEPRGTRLKVALGLVLGGMVGLFWAFAHELLRREREDGTEEYREFSDLWSRTWRDVRTLGGRLS